jgi:Zn-dependent metalloprotease
MSNVPHCAQCTVVPPHIIEALARSASPDQREAAIRTLAADASFRQARLAAQVVIAQGLGAAASVGPPRKNRRIFDAQSGTNLPGVLVRAEGQAATSDAATNEAYDGLGGTWDLYWDVYGRNSIDDAGMDLIGSVHYGEHYDNAQWNGAQMLFGDGDGTVFNRFTLAVDVVGHELTHGVTGHTANLVYADQSGALNESVSDVFGSLVKQYVASPQQTAADADWLIGAGLFTSQVDGVALRSMKAPGTAYDDAQLGGKDPQPAHVSGYVTTTADNGGVHINSGIPNHAFYLAAVALGGHAWEKAGRIWYETLRDPSLAANAQFADFAKVTVTQAASLFGVEAEGAVTDAWRQVGVAVGGAPTAGSASPDRIEVVRTGGFAGIPRRGSIELADTPRPEHEEARQAVDDLRAAAARAGPDLAQPDAFTYTIAVTAGGRRDELTVPESAVPDSARAFLDRVLRGPR